MHHASQTYDRCQKTDPSKRCNLIWLGPCLFLKPADYFAQELRIFACLVPGARGDHDRPISIASTGSAPFGDGAATGTPGSGNEVGSGSGDDDLEP